MSFNANECFSTRLVWTDRLTTGQVLDFEQKIFLDIDGDGDDLESGDADPGP